MYKEHLLTTHSEEFFHCAECDTYVDRKSLVIHMSLHAIQYATNNKNAGDNNAKSEKATVKKIGKNNNEVSEAEPQHAQKTDVANINNNLVINTTRINVVINSQSKFLINNVLDTGQQNKRKIIQSQISKSQENEFSDHSDTDNGFDPLPESIFEAIDDSQDNQIPAEEKRPSAAEPNEPARSESTSEQTKKKKQQAPRTCPICHKVYKASSSYFYHMKYFHRGSKDHQCQICGRKFGTRANLAQHASVHSKKFDFECNECGKKFRNKVSLYIHIQNHNSNKSFPCDKCPQTFRWKQQLIRHIKRHADEKSHSCSVCGRGFKVRYDMLRHMRTHDAGSHTCSMCGVCFAQLRYLKTHMDKKHPMKIENDDSNWKCSFNSGQYFLWL